ncbi:fam-a protein [Plasmodium vinckei lentum]|uniref:Fam-a protein n=1 Tax=Plasmodium vinckei lentum TaxID=138297 RepID=A0A6V7RV50_PLAVN|nr:fam-a protein [Plasmodium vinckei lentum]
MKVMSVGLISLIIFNIVLAKNNSDSGPTTNSSSLLEEKTKKTHKTTEESVNVKDKGPYEEDYEEDYEDMIKDIFMPLKSNHQHIKNNSHKQDDASPPVSKEPKKQKFTEKRQLLTINENKEICQKPKDLLCTYLEKDTKTESTTESKTKSKKHCDTSEEIYEQNEHLLCTNPEETKEAIELMDEAVMHLVHHATNEDDYILEAQTFSNDMFYYKKKYKGKINFEKILCISNSPNKYDTKINKLWDPKNPGFFNHFSFKAKIVRVYNPDLVMIQKRFKDSMFGRWKYFYALVKKTQLSDNTTVIAMSSANINDHNTKDKESHQNAVIESANLFKTDIESEDDIRNGKLKKTFVNIAGYLIKKTNKSVTTTFVTSINGYSRI